MCNAFIEQSEPCVKIFLSFWFVGFVHANLQVAGIYFFSIVLEFLARFVNCTFLTTYGSYSPFVYIMNT